MTRLIILFAITIVTAPIGTFGQNKTYVGIEAAVTEDFYKINDNAGEIKKAPSSSGLWGINIKQEITNKLFLETGLVRKYYSDGVNFKKISSTSTTNEFNAWFIPIRVGASLNLKKNKIFIVPVIGYNFCINSNYDDDVGGTGASGFVEESNGNTVTYSYTSNHSLKAFSILQAGIGIEFKLLKTVSVSLYSNYYFGINEINVLDIRYSINNSNTQSAGGIGKGNMTSFGVQVKYPISTFWTKSK